MLQFLRGHASSWFMKILLGLIALSFGVFGITSLFIGRGQQVLVAKVGKVEISKQYLLHEVQQRLKNANQELKDINLTLEQAVKMGLAKKILDDLVRKILIEQELNDLNITVSEGTLSSMVLKDPAFKNDQGRFDGQRFKQILANNNLTEASYMGRRARQLVEAQFISGISAASKPAGSLSLKLFNDLFEERLLTLYTVDTKALLEMNPPLKKVSEAELKEHYAAHESAFMMPEKRSFSVLILDPKTLEKQFTFTNQEIKDAYAQQLDTYAVPEKRDIQVFTDKEWRKVKAVNKVFARNEKPAKGTVTTLYNITQAELDEKLGEEAFDMAAGEFSDVYRTVEGFQVVKVLKITPATIKPLKKVRKHVVAELKRQRAMDAMATLIQTIEDAISGGATIEEIAKDHALPVRTVTLMPSQTARLPKGIQEHMIQTAFEQDVSEIGPVVELEDGMAYVVRVDQIQTAALPPLKTVKGQVKKHLMAQRLQESQNKAIDGILKDVTLSKKQRNKVDADPVVNTRTLPAMNFTGSKDHPSVKPDILREAWNLKKGQSARVTYEGKPAVIYVRGITPATVEQRLGDYTSLKHEMSEMLNRDILTQYFNALKEKHGVTVYDDILQTLAE